MSVSSLSPAGLPMLGRTPKKTKKRSQLLKTKYLNFFKCLKCLKNIQFFSNVQLKTITKTEILDTNLSIPGIYCIHTFVKKLNTQT